MKLFNPAANEPLLTKRVRTKHPRCRCGCGKAAHWPKDGKPVFYSRLCGYLMAVEMFRRRVV